VYLTKHFVEAFKELKQLLVLPLAGPRQSYPHIFVVLEIGLVSVDYDRIVVIAAQSPQQLQITVVLLF